MDLLIPPYAVDPCDSGDPCAFDTGGGCVSFDPCQFCAVDIEICWIHGTICPVNF